MLRRHLVRFSRLLATTGLGVLGALLLGRTLLGQLPSPTPQTSRAQLRLEARLALNPWRRRQAALLLASSTAGDSARRNRLLQGQGWGQDPLAAVVLKLQALDATALGRLRRAEALWQQLLRRFAGLPASADALYALGQRQPALRQRLWQRHAAHPAALAAALEHPGLTGALHLARWGSRWPGASARLQAACATPDLDRSQRQQLAQGLAEVGDLEGTLRCLQGTSPLPRTTLLLAAAELQGDAAAQRQGRDRLLQLLRQAPNSGSSAAAVRLLADDPGPAAQDVLAQLPKSWQQSAPVQAALARQHEDLNGALAVMRRWPADAASWELQWQLARRAALAQRWDGARQLLAAGGPRLAASLPVALQARRRFWLGLSHWQLGQRQQARAQWQLLLREHPGGYYGWRAALRLQTRPDAAAAAIRAQPRWTPLASGDALVDQLWRLGQPLEAFETWRSRSRGRRPDDSRGLQAEGRLREAIGDGWSGLGQLELAALRLPPGQCQLQQLIEGNRYRPRQRQALEAAARSEAVPLPLLLGVAKQESRFQSTVRSVVGAAGLLQLMPETAADVAGRPVTPREIDDPVLNAQLGARYLRQLLSRWNGDPLLSVASYNAGPNAVARWLSPQLGAVPELWVEAIPYPETRHYVKTVLGNSWSFADPARLRCP